MSGKKKTEEIKDLITLSMYPSQHEKLKQIAFIKRRSASEIITVWIKRYIEQNKDDLHEYESLTKENLKGR